MGIATDGILAYGYDLGGGEEEWKVRDAGEYGELDVPWWDSGDDDADFEDAVTDTLLRAAGLAEGSTWERLEAGGREAIGVEVVTYCSDVSPMYALCAVSLEAARGHVKDAAELLAADRSRWDERLAWALGVLGLAPVQDKPSWLLCSYGDGFND